MPFLSFVLLCAEIALLIKFGQAVGGGPVFLEILLTGGLGILLLRMAGRSVFDPARLLELFMRPPTRAADAPWTAGKCYVDLLYPGVTD